MSAAVETAEKATKFNLSAAMAAVDLSAPNVRREPVMEGETVLGVMSEDLRRLDRVRCEMLDKQRTTAESYKKLAVDHFEKHLRGLRGDCKAFHVEIERLGTELDLLTTRADKINQIFWFMVELEFGLGENASLSLREGDQVVVGPETPTPVEIHEIARMALSRMLANMQ